MLPNYNISVFGPKNYDIRSAVWRFVRYKPSIGYVYRCICFRFDIFQLRLNWSVIKA